MHDRDEDALHRALLEQVRDHAIFVIGPDGRNRTWNLGVERVLGYGRDEFVGRHTREIFTPEDRAEGVPERELSFAAEEGEASDERWLQRKDGSRLWASGMTTRLLDGDGQLLGFAKVFRDLTVEREYESRLKHLTERLQVGARTAHLTLYDRDLNTSTFTWTEGSDGYGYAADGVGPNIAWWEERIHPSERDRIVAGLHDAVESGAKQWRAEYRFRRADGSYATVYDEALVMRSSDDVPLRMLGTLTDVTERARAEADLRRAHRLEALGRLGGGVAHELNNALTSIIGFGDLLERSLPTQDDRREYTAPLLRSAWHGARLVRELLTFSRREPVARAGLDLNAVVRRVVRLLEPLLGERITVVTELAPSAALVLADEGQLEQVILSLAINARDAMPEGGTLRIETLPGTITGDRIPERHPGAVPKTGEYVGLVLTDTGCGMSPHTIEHLFEPFYTTKGIGEGTGLGLAAAYGALRQNEGYIYVTSEPGQGSSFAIYLPVALSDD
ncbi:MAG: PAS domain S-box protein [Gemmatimonadales bacterium]|jgi:two-component system cell cycle sensor histidine kinase/response regulator CckA